jgi:hypothetical protein
MSLEKVGGPLVRPTSESKGKTRYTSTTTWPMFGVTPVSRPVKVAEVIEVWAVRPKSSPVSISNFPGLSGRAAVAILPSVFPVLNVNASAAAHSDDSDQPFQRIPISHSDRSRSVWCGVSAPLDAFLISVFSPGVKQG